jgi:hypothetical protein
MSLLRHVLGPDVKADLSDDEITQLRHRLEAAEADRDRAQHLAKQRLVLIEKQRAEIARLREGGEA